MDGRADEDDHAAFYGIDGTLDADGDPLVLSWAALELHAAALESGAKHGHPSFVCDEYLDAIGHETAVTAVELCAAQLWQRFPGGYLFIDRETTNISTNQVRKIATLRERCRRAGRHEPDHANPHLCRRCNAWLPTAEG